MKAIKSTGNAEQDAKLIEEALGKSNVESLDEATARAAKSSSGKHFGNILVTEPHQAGETLLVLRDGEEEKVHEPKQQEKVLDKPLLKTTDVQKVEDKQK